MRLLAWHYYGRYPPIWTPFSLTLLQTDLLRGMFMNKIKLIAHFDVAINMKKLYNQKLAGMIL